MASIDALGPKIILFAVETAPALPAYLQRREIDWPLIALSRSRDIDVAVETMKMGALDFLFKPVDEDRLMGAIRSGSDLLTARLQRRDTRRSAEARVSALSKREGSICHALLAGQPNKVIAYNLGISIRTVEAHRSNIMMKLGVRSFAEAFLLLTQAGLTPVASEAPPLHRRVPMGLPMLHRKAASFALPAMA